MSPLFRLILSLGTLLSVFLVGTVGYMALETEANPPFLDAAYMTAITLSTVGYQEVWELSPAGRVWTSLIILFGIAAASFSLTSMVTLFVSGEIQEARGRKRMQQSIDRMNDHVIICGFGRMGSLVMEGLKGRGVSVLVIENDRSLEEDLHGSGIPYIMGDATEEEHLEQAGLMRASALVTVLPTDSDNVFITLTAHTLNPKMQIIARAEQSSTLRKLKRAGASSVICPQIIGATRITNVLTRPNVVDFVEMASKGVDLEMDEYIINSTSRLAGVSLKKSLVREKTGATVVAIKRTDGQTLFNPDPSIVLDAGDTLIIVGPAGASEKFDQLD